MFDRAPRDAVESADSLTTGQLRELVAKLGRMDGQVDDAERVEQIRLLEELKGAAAAAQARVVVAFADSQVAKQAAAGVPAPQQGRGVAAQVGLAKRESHQRASRFVGFARILTSELPRTCAALAAGQITEWRAMIVACETVWLSAEHRAVVDAELGPRLPDWGDRRVEAEVRKAAYRLDPHGFTERARAAASQRHVSTRPAADSMLRLHALLPLKEGVACYAELSRAADSARATGDARTRGQVMADTLIARITGTGADTSIGTRADAPEEITWAACDSQKARADAEKPQSALGSDASGDAGGLGVGVNLILTDTTLFGGDAEPGWLVGHGPVPAPQARAMVAEAARVWLRRLYADPSTGQLVGLERASAARLFEPDLRDLLVSRDLVCRTPWCDAPIRHADHCRPVSAGGPTSGANGQGLCEACNYAKQAPGWAAAASRQPDGRHTVVTTTPTGHRYASANPDPPRAIGRAAGADPPEVLFVDVYRPALPVEVELAA